VARVEAGAVVAVRDVDAPRPGNGVRVNGLRRVHAVLPFFLHVGVHHQEGVVREVDGDLACLVRSGGGGGVVGVILGDDAADAELAGDAEGEGADDGAGSEVG
jgi:hypothetical protein